MFCYKCGYSLPEDANFCSRCGVAVSLINSSGTHIAEKADKCVIGNSFETNALLAVGDIARRSGLYILGEPGTGKSVLMTQLALQDIEHGHGVFFLDPHGDAIEDILARCNRHESIIMLDPEDEAHSFGINPLLCKNLDSFEKLGVAYHRTYNVFDKIWKNVAEAVWLQKIIEFAIYVFIENPGYTLAEVPLFLKDAEFRELLLRNVKHNPEAVNFWQRDYRYSHAEAALTRIYTLLGHPIVNHIISQPKTTIDFAEIMEKRLVVLAKVPSYHSADVKKFIGTILVSELVYAAQNRTPDKRHQFCIFVDEVQNYTGDKDFDVLFTEARKYGIATTIAHQERFGQFAENEKMTGATAAAGNKVYFALSVKDSQELAPEFAKAPSTELRQEREMVISPEPLAAFLKQGHKNPEIYNFVVDYIEKIKEEIEDIKGQVLRDRTNEYTNERWRCRLNEFMFN